ncbi:hypothetical protein J3R83DRAFT_11816 [Lanmaoa asiatica]|nr:hypothetical protein J3R83DRAFT_11816 [Lanmaoa asiatica]
MFLGEDSPTNTSSNYVRHFQAAQPDALRGAMLVALIVVTIVLYIVLWELERSSFVSVPKPNLNQSVMVASPSRGSSETTSRRYPPAVFQDGPVFPSGEVSNLSDDRIAVPSSKPGRTAANAWPPPITRVPEEHDTGDLAEKVDDRTYKDGNMSKPSSLDSAYCNGVCRFLLPVRVGEQESKARIHFTQLLMLAQRLNRTIILPNVGKSRMSACSKWPFGAYYDTDVFVDKSDSPDSRLGDRSRRFCEVGRREIGATEQLHRRRDVLGTQNESEDVPFIVEKAGVDLKALSCLESKLARLRSSLPETGLSISFTSDSLKMESDTRTHLVQLLSNSLDMDMDSDFNLMTGLGYEYTPQYINSSQLSLADIDVIVLDYDLRHPLFAASVQSSFSLHYAPVLYDLADRLSDNLGPFVGVHWRMENVPVQNLAWCAASLVSTLHALLQDNVTGKNVRHVWLATDHPRPLSTFMDSVRFPMDDDPMSSERDGSILQDYRSLRKSSTFKALTSEHDDAIGILAEAFEPGGDLEAWKLTDIAEQLRRYPYVEGRFDVNEALLDDSGVFGILDKLVVVQARVFVSGSTECSKTRFVQDTSDCEFEAHEHLSSFSKQVIEARQEPFEVERGKGSYPQCCRILW